MLKREVAIERGKAFDSVSVRRGEKRATSTEETSRFYHNKGGEGAIVPKLQSPSTLSVERAMWIGPVSCQKLAAGTC